MRLARNFARIVGLAEKPPRSLEGVDAHWMAKRDQMARDGIPVDQFVLAVMNIDELQHSPGAWLEKELRQFMRDPEKYTDDTLGIRRLTGTQIWILEILDWLDAAARKLRSIPGFKRGQFFWFKR